MGKRREAESKALRLGEVLVSHGLITREQRRQALQRQKHTAQRLGEILVAEGLLTRDELNWALGSLLGVPYVELDASMVDRNLVAAVPAELLRRCQAMPMVRVEDVVTVAMADPTDGQAVADIESVLGANVQVAMADSENIEATLAALAADAPAPAELRVELPRAPKRAPSTRELLDDTSGKRFIHHHVRRACRQGADEILIQPRDGESFRVRYRVHGRLVDEASYPTPFLGTVIARLKLLAKLGLAPGQLFQDGRVTLDVDGKTLEAVASVYATIHGPGARVRLIAPPAEPRALKGLGFERAALAALRRAATAPSGLILACGPRASGCSTTLYAVLREIPPGERDIVTLERTTACRYPDATQLQVRAQSEYLRALGSLAEAAPGVLLAEGLHDRGFWAALGPESLTSSLLLGEMRADDTLSALSQLREVGVGDAVLASSLRLIVAQRLIPRLDPRAREPERLSRRALAEVADLVPEAAEARFYQARTDAQGQRIVRGLDLVAEILEPNEEVRDLLLQGAPAPQIRAACSRAGLTTLRQCTIRKAAQGKIQLEPAP